LVEESTVQFRLNVGLPEGTEPAIPCLAPT